MIDKSDNWEDKVGSLILKAEQEESAAQAILYYEQALSLVPLPIEKSDYATVIYINIGEHYYLIQNYEQAFACFNKALRCKHGLGSGHVHLRLGQIRFERKEIERAKDELMRAFMASGYLIFESEDPKYYELIKDIVEKHPSSLALIEQGFSTKRETL